MEIRRFGFNLDHGGVNGGLKVLVDDIQQNQGTQGHGQSYLGALKTLTPELIQDVSILNGPFSAEYGDFSGLGVVYSSVRYRHIGNYRLDGKDATIRAAGLDVIDLAVTRSIRGWIDFNVAVDNLTNKHYYETQNFFESRVSPTAEAMERIHGTAGYPIGVTAGLTFHLAGKQ
ncbi:MAG TPA: TonB-dependent receptor plug domain-containing protein [Terriglobia bacterium]|nr:TonB-dependent receptor plug domain-containing protein [Terriglobia bacterium]